MVQKGHPFICSYNNDSKSQNGNLKYSIALFVYMMFRIDFQLIRDVCTAPVS